MSWGHKGNHLSSPNHTTQPNKHKGTTNTNYTTTLKHFWAHRPLGLSLVYSHIHWFCELNQHRQETFWLENQSSWLAKSLISPTAHPFRWGYFSIITIPYYTKHKTSVICTHRNHWSFMLCIAMPLLKNGIHEFHFSILFLKCFHPLMCWLTWLLWPIGANWSHCNRLYCDNLGCLL